MSLPARKAYSTLLVSPLLVCFCALVALPHITAAQNSIPRNSEALDKFAQSEAAFGGTTLWQSFRDYTATGSIVIYSRGGDVSGTVTIRLLGMDQLRIDSTLPKGTISSVANRAHVWRREPDGTISTSSRNVAIHPATYFLPSLAISKALRETTTSLTSINVQDQGQNKTEHGVKVGELPSEKADPFHVLAQWSHQDFYFTDSSPLISRSHDLMLSISRQNKSIAHDIAYGDYRSVNGVQVPFSITESIGGQPSFTIHLTDVRFNTGLRDNQFLP